MKINQTKQVFNFHIQTGISIDLAKKIIEKYGNAEIALNTCSHFQLWAGKCRCEFCKQ